MDDQKQPHSHIWPPGLVEQLVATLNDSLPCHTASGEPLVIGIFGEWGSGKSALLAEVARCIEQQAKADFAQADFEKLTLPIRFNPWRYEREEHLIIPLLKSSREQLVRLQEHYYQGKDSDEAVAWLREKARLLKDTALAVGAGLKIKGPFFDIDLKKILDADRENQGSDPLAHYESIYYDLLQHLESLTQGEDGRSLNLIFFIDDLDRCLPDKAVEMLESIKLFFDVQGCAFMLAVDDEVVERGIAHRYRDYRKEGNGDLPISGHEYLEKIIQLPIRLPTLREHEVHELLTTRFAELFVIDAEPLEQALGEGEGRAVALGKLHDPARRTAMLQLFVRAIPPVPRKLIRAAELTRFCLELAEADEWEECDPLTTARLVLIQLFAPALYRLGRRRYGHGFLAQMEQWAESADHYWWTDEGLGMVAAAECEEEKRVGDGSRAHQRAQRNYERIYLPLVEQIRTACRGRTGFDPRELVSADYPCDPLSPYLALADVATGPGTLQSDKLQKADMAEPVGKLRHISKTFSLRWGAGEPIKSPHSARLKEGHGIELRRDALHADFEQTGHPNRLVGVPAGFDTDRDEIVRPSSPTEFLDQLLSSSPAQWLATIEAEEQLAYFSLDEHTFKQLQRELEALSYERSSEWWELVLTILSKSQRCAIDLAIGLTEKMVLELSDLGVDVYERVATGRALVHLGDPRPGVGCLRTDLGELLPAPSWVYVPGTQEVVSSGRWPDFDGFWPGDERWVHDQPANISPLWVAAYPVTWAQFTPFVTSGSEGYTNYAYWTKAGMEARGNQMEPYLWDDYQARLPNHPVVGVTWFQVVAWCRWADAQLHAAGCLPEGYELRLLTELEWEWAARGPAGSTWPWGETRDKRRCNNKELELLHSSVVGAFPSGASEWMRGMAPEEGLNSLLSLDSGPDTLLDLAGNIWEWTATPWHATLQPPEAATWADESLEGDGARVLRGGSFGGDLYSCRGAQRERFLRSDGDRTIGFRCCVASSSRS